MGERAPIEPDLWKRLTEVERKHLLQALRPASGAKRPRPPKVRSPKPKS